MLEVRPGREWVRDQTAASEGCGMRVECESVAIQIAPSGLEGVDAACERTEDAWTGYAVGVCCLCNIATVMKAKDVRKEMKSASVSK